MKANCSAASESLNARLCSMLRAAFAQRAIPSLVCCTQQCTQRQCAVLSLTSCQCCPCTQVEVRKALAPAVKIKPKARPAPPTPANTPEVKRPRLNDQPAAAAVVPAVLEAAANLVQKGQGQAEQEPESTESLAAQPADLTGLLGGYGSDSEEDS